MRKMLLLAALAAFVSCAKKESREAPAAAPEKAGEATAPRAGLAEESRKIVRTGTLRLTVESYDSSRQAIDALVTEAGGFVAASHVSQDRSADLVLRVPSDKLLEIAHRIGQLGKVIDEQMTAEDVTEAWVDTEARLKNARAMEARLLEIVAKGTDKVADLLEVERELGRVRGEIEVLDARMRTLSGQVSLATLNVSLYENEKVAAVGFGARAERSLGRSWQALMGFGRGLALFAIALLPWLPPIALVVWLFSRWRKRTRSRRPAAGLATEAGRTAGA